MKKIGILTSGGDAPGMNSAIHTLVKGGKQIGIEVLGFNKGYQGLIDLDYQVLDVSKSEAYESRGGTILGTSRCLDFLKPEVRQATVAKVKDLGLDGLIVIGGEGSYQGALALHQLGLNTIAVPGTIDNDIANTDQTIGFYTAVKSVVAMVDQVKTTAASHEFIFAVEVMGRRAPDIAYWAGNALDVEGIIYRPQDMHLEKVLNQIKRSRQQGKNYQIFIVAEGISSAQNFVDWLKPHLDYNIRPLNLGHVQRGGAPAALDRLLAKGFAEKALAALTEGSSGLNVAIKGRHILLQKLEETITAKKELVLPYFF